MKAKKLKYTARVDFSEKEIEYLADRYRPGQLVLWNVLGKAKPYGIWLIAPDFSRAKTISFNTLEDDDEVRKANDLQVGDTVKMAGSLPENKLREITILSVKESKPVYADWDHRPPQTVEEAMKTADDVKIKRSIFRLHGLPFVKDKTRQVVITSDKGDVWKFPYRTNKVFYIDEKRFCMLLESHHIPMLAVSAYLSKNSHYQYRMKMSYWPDVLNYFFTPDAELEDLEGITYKVRIEEKKA